MLYIISTFSPGSLRMLQSGIGTDVVRFLFPELELQEAIDLRGNSPLANESTPAQVLKSTPSIVLPSFKFNDRTVADPEKQKRILDYFDTQEGFDLLQQRGYRSRMSEEKAGELAARGLDPRDGSLQAFLDLDISNLPEVNGLNSRLLNADIIQKHLLKSIFLGEQIFVFCDYDVDGLTSGSQFIIACENISNIINSLKFNCQNPDELFLEFGSQFPAAEKVISEVYQELYPHFNKMNYESLGQFSLHVEPAKRMYNFGLHDAAIEKAIELGTKLFLLLDCGLPHKSAERDLGKRLTDAGMKVCIIDHHNIEGEIPGNLIVANPHQKGCGFAGGVLSTAGIVSLLLRDFTTAVNEREILAYGGLGCYCDVMPLKGATRILVSNALDFFKRKPRSGMEQLLKTGGTISEYIEGDTLGFYIGPQLNAVGRMTNLTEIVLELLTTRDKNLAKKHSDFIRETNMRRKQLERDKVLYALDNFELSGSAIVGSFNGVPQFEGQPGKGIVGLVAAFLTHSLQKPCFALAGENNTETGSGRSPEGYHLAKALERIGEKVPFLSKGGHGAAAGCKLASSELENFRQALVHDSGLHTNPAPIISIDYHKEIKLSEVNKENYRKFIQLISPCGKECESPTVLVRGVLVEEVSVVNDFNLLLTLRQEGERRYARWFKQGAYVGRTATPFIEAGKYYDIAATMHVENNGKLATHLYLNGLLPCSEPTWTARDNAVIDYLRDKMSLELLPWDLKVKEGQDKIINRTSEDKAYNFKDLPSSKENITPTEKKLKKLAKVAAKEAEVEALRESLFDDSLFTAETPRIQFKPFSEFIDDEPDGGLIFSGLMPPQHELAVPSRLSFVPTPDDIEEVTGFEDMQSVMLPNGISINVPSNYHELFERYPCSIVRVDSLEARPTQLKQLTYIFECRRQGLPIDMVLKFKVDGGKTCFALLAIAHELEKGSRCFFAVNNQLLVNQVIGEVKKFLHFRNPKTGKTINIDDLVASRKVNLKKRMHEYDKEWRLLVTTPLVLKNDRERSAKIAALKFDVEVWDECHILRGNSNYSRLNRALGIPREHNPQQIAMSGLPAANLEKCKIMRDREFPGAEIREVHTPEKTVQFEITPVTQRKRHIEAVDFFEEKMIRATLYIQKLLSAFEVPQDVCEDLLKAKPLKSRHQRRLEGKKTPLFDWSMRFNKDVANFQKRDKSLQIKSYGALCEFMEDLNKALSFYERHPHVTPRMLDVLQDAYKWLLVLNELYFMTDVLCSSESFAFLRHTIERCWKVQYGGIGGVDKPGNFERIIFSDPGVIRIIRSVARGLEFDKIFTMDFGDLCAEICEREKSSFIDPSRLFKLFIAHAKKQYIDEIVSGERRNGPKTTALIEQLKSELSSDRMAKSIVFCQLAENAIFLTELINSLGLDFKSTFLVDKSHLNAAEISLQNENLEKLKRRHSRMRNVVATDTARQGLNIRDLRRAYMFNAELQILMIYQKIGRLRGDMPVVRCITSGPAGYDLQKGESCRRAHSEAVKPWLESDSDWEEEGKFI